MAPDTLAAYLRLSNADRDLSEKEESNSIANQRSLIKNYLLTHPDLSAMKYREFVDDGYTGTNTQRPAFKKLIAQAKAGKIHAVIVKDLSRFSRDYLVLGDYVEQIFPMLGVRFLSINDHYDSKETDSYLETMNIALQSLVYSYYSKDLSKKRSSSVEYRMKSGSFIGSAPYGYISNWKLHRYEIDPETAPIVQLIFTLAAQGMRPAAIANHLNSQKILTPAQYNAAHPEYGKSGKYWKNNHPLWRYSMVSRILSNIVYLGNLEMRKTHTSLTEQNKTVSVPPEERLVRIHAHDPIISQDLYDTAHEALKRPTSNCPKRKILPVTTPLKGKLQCGFCGMTLRFRNDRKNAFCLSSQLKHSICPSTNYPINEIEQFVYRQTSFALQQLIHMKETQEAEIQAMKKGIKPCQAKITLLQNRLDNLRNEKRKLFELLSDGTLSTDDFCFQKSSLQESIDSVQRDLNKLHQELEKRSGCSVSDELIHLAEIASEHLASGKLTEELLQKYIETIIIYGPGNYQIKWKHENLFVTLLEQSLMTDQNLTSDDSTLPPQECEVPHI